MNPKRILLPIAIALAAIACTAPAAQADVFLEDNDGTLEEGGLVTATSFNLVTTRPDGTIFECANVAFHLELMDSGPTHLELKQLGEATTSGCKLDRSAIGLPNLPMTIDDYTLNVGEGNILTIDTSGTGNTNISFLMTIFTDAEHKFLAAACTFAGPVHVVEKGETSDELEVTPSALNGGACGESTVEADFTLETSNEDPVLIHHEVDPDPTNVSLSDSKGTLKAGALFTATSTNLVTTRPNKTTLECANVTLHMELIDSGPTHLELEQLGAATATGCQLNRSALELPNLPVTIDDGTLGVGEGNILTIDTWGTGNTNASFLATVFADPEHKVLAAACTITGPVHVVAKGETSDELNVTPSTLNGGEVCGELTMEGDFTLETSNKDPVLIHYEETPTNVSLSDKDGTLKAGALVTATSTNLVTTRPDKTKLECASVALHMELTDPGPEHLELEQIGEATTSGCKLNREASKEPNLPMTIDDGTLGVGEESTLTIDAWGTGNTGASFLSTVFADAEHKTLVTACTFTGPVHVVAPVDTSDELEMRPSVLNGGLCGESTLEADFTLETEDGDPVLIHYRETS